MSDDDLPLGDDKAKNAAAAVARSVVGMIPLVGAPLTELINVFIPNVRADRIENYLRLLNERINQLSEDDLRQRLMNEPAMDLVEEGAFQAVRALTEARREHIATTVAGGLSGDNADLLEARRILNLLKQLDDAQLIILASKLLKNQSDEFWDTHADIISAPIAHLQSTREDIDRSTIHEIAKHQLNSLGLTKPRFKRFKKGEMPEMDPKTGAIVANGSDITPLGRLLLRVIGLADENDV